MTTKVWYTCCWFTPQRAETYTVTKDGGLVEHPRLKFYTVDVVVGKYALM